MNKYTFSVIGGDFRTITAANRLLADGHIVKVFGFDDFSSFNSGILCAPSLYDALLKSDFILLPLPYSTKEGYISTPCFSGEIKISDLLFNMEKQTILLGKADPAFCDLLKEKQAVYFDYMKSEEFSVKNAVPTAEGAVEIALRELPITLNGSSCLVTGFGRISKILSALLKGFGAHVTVAARSHSDIAWILATGYDGIYINDLESNIHKYNVVFNTVPHQILNEKVLRNIKKNCLIIDLASKPGGVDFDLAQKLDLNVIWALSLPGKVAPITAGEIITETILNIIKEKEELQ